MILGCQQYDAPIVIMQKQEASLLLRAGNDVKKYSWKAFEGIAVKYKHINVELGKTIQTQQNCYDANKDNHRTDKAWATYHFNNYPEDHQKSGN
jgi:hypothetical protein